MKTCEHDSHQHFERLIGPIRERARALGYAIAVHGSLARDIDLIAVPWTEKSADARILAEAVRATAAAHNNGIAAMHPADEANGWISDGRQPYGQPHGRRSWCFHLVATCDGPYIDLSVMPRAVDWEAMLPTH